MYRRDQKCINKNFLNKRLRVFNYLWIISSPGCWTPLHIKYVKYIIYMTTCNTINEDLTFKQIIFAHTLLIPPVQSTPEILLQEYSQ